MVATVHVDLSDHAGGDSIPRARALRFDPLGDTLAGTAVLVDAVTVQIDRSTGQASHVNGRAVAGGLVPLAAGVVYRLSGLAQTHTVGPLADGDAVELSAVIVPGEPSGYIGDPRRCRMTVGSCSLTREGTGSCCPTDNTRFAAQATRPTVAHG